MTWLTARVEAATPLEAVLGLRPELDGLVGDYIAEIWSAGDPVVLELCRLRIAALHGDDGQQRLRHDSALAAGLSEEKIADLAAYPRAPNYSDHERACLAYAEQFVVDVHGITDDDAERVKATMSDAEFVAFTVALGMFDGIGRLRLTLGVTEPAADGPVVVPTPTAGAAAH